MWTDPRVPLQAKLAAITATGAWALMAIIYNVTREADRA